MATAAAGLLAAGMELAGRTWSEAVAAFDWDAAGYDVYALHQVSKVHTRAVARTDGAWPPSSRRYA